MTLREDLHDAVTRGARELLGADTCQIWRLDPEADELVLAAADPPEPGARPLARPCALLLDMVRRGDAAASDRRRRAPARGAAHRRGRAARAAVLRPQRALLRRRGRGVAAGRCEPDRVGLKKAELIERLTAENIVKDMFEALAAGSVQTAEVKAGEARCDRRPRLPARRARARGGETLWPELAGRVQSRLRRLHRRAFFDARHDSLRALVPLPALDQGAAEGLRLACEELGAELGVDIGISDSERGAGSARRRMREAADAARIARSLAAAGGRLLRTARRLPLSRQPRARRGAARPLRPGRGALIDYDRDRNANLVDTLERYLAARCSVAASARALYIHPNTVRQRLERIQQITKLDLREEDLLSSSSR